MSPAPRDLLAYLSPIGPMDQIALGISQDIPVAAFDLLVGIIAAGAAALWP